VIKPSYSCIKLSANLITSFRKPSVIRAINYKNAVYNTIKYPDVRTVCGPIVIDRLWAGRGSVTGGCINGCGWVTVTHITIVWVILCRTTTFKLAITLVIIVVTCIKWWQGVTRLWSWQCDRPADRVLLETQHWVRHGPPLFTWLLAAASCTN